MYALVFQGEVIQIEEKPFLVHESLQWVPIGPEQITEGYLFDGEKFIKPPEPEQKIIPDTVFQLATKIMIKSMMQFINGTISKIELNAKFDEVKNYLKEITID